MRGGSGFRLSVVNPGGRDPEQDFADGSPRGAHAPVNFHAYAACTGGRYFRDAKRAAEAAAPALVLLRGDFRESKRAVDLLKNAGCAVAISLKETGLHQIAAQLADPPRLRRFADIVRTADGCIAPTPEAADFYRTIREDAEAVAFIPTPYPLHDSAWNLSRPIRERRGIFVGTREWDVPSRNHALALVAAKRLHESTRAPVTVYNVDGRRGERLLGELQFPAGVLRVLKRGVDYADYLRVVAEHRIVLEMDTSFVPGQVAGDALLCRLPCVGGNGAIDRLGHPATCGGGRSVAELIEIATRLLRDDLAYEEAVAHSQRAASEQLSFAGVARQLREFFATLRPRA